MNDSTEPIKQDGFNENTNFTYSMPSNQKPNTLSVSIVTWGKFARQTDDNDFIWL